MATSKTLSNQKASGVTELKNFAFLKVLSVKAYELISKDLLAYMDKLSDFNLDDSTPTEYLKGGENMGKLIPVVGEQEVKLTLTSALTNFDWLSLKMNDTVRVESTSFNSDVYSVVSEAKVTVPTATNVRSVFVSNAEANNRDENKLEATTESSVTTGKYKFDPDTHAIAVDATLNGKTLHIYFDEDVDGAKAVTSSGKQAKVIELIVDAVVKDADTQIPFIAQVRVPRASISQVIKMSAKNEGVPDMETLEFDAMFDKVLGGSYELKTKAR